MGDGRRAFGGRRPLIPVLVALGVAAVGAVAFALLAGGDDPHDPETGGNGGPAAVAEGFFTAQAARDCRGMVGLISASSFEAAAATPDAARAQCQEAMASSADREAEGGMPVEIEVTSTEVVSEDGSTAIVAVELREGGATRTREVRLVEEGGEWGVDFAALAGERGERDGAAGPTSDP